MGSYCMGFSNCNFKEVLTFRIKSAKDDKSSLLVQILNIQKSVSVLHILPTLFWPCIDIFPNRTFLDAWLIGFFHFQCLVNPLGNDEIFAPVFPSIGHSSTVNDVIQGWLNSVVEIIEGFTLVGSS